MGSSGLLLQAGHTYGNPARNTPFLAHHGTPLCKAHKFSLSHMLPCDCHALHPRLTCHPQAGRPSAPPTSTTHPHTFVPSISHAQAGRPSAPPTVSTPGRRGCATGTCPGRPWGRPLTLLQVGAAKSWEGVVPSTPNPYPFHLLWPGINPTLISLRVAGMPQQRWCDMRAACGP